MSFEVERSAHFLGPKEAYIRKHLDAVLQLASCDPSVLDTRYEDCEKVMRNVEAQCLWDYKAQSLVLDIDQGTREAQIHGLHQQVSHLNEQVSQLMTQVAQEKKLLDFRTEFDRRVDQVKNLAPRSVAEAEIQQLSAMLHDASARKEQLQTSVKERARQIQVLDMVLAQLQDALNASS
jgi:chromosome segregation ATPase